jgi:medium-chain acyl-[acyl-carrier-protein] hydrolase
MSTSMGKLTVAERGAMSPWLTNIRPNPDASTRLFCVPYAGGGPQVFQPWPDILPRSFEIWAVNLPGRGKRMIETPFVELPSLVAAMMEDIVPAFDKPFALFGHSMGALICYEVVRSLRKKNGPMPVHLFASGCFAPHLPDPNPIHHLAHDEFLKELCRLGGMPREVLESQELMELILPSLRADFTATETYIYNDEPPLPVPISVFGGWRDPLTTRESLEAWRIHTTGYFSTRMLPGDHFFLHSVERVLLELIVSELRQATCPQ